MNVARPGGRWSGALAACLLLALGAAASADFYSWRDAQGELHFGDRPPADAVDVQQRRAAAPRSEAADAASEPAGQRSHSEPRAAGPWLWQDPEARFTLSLGADWLPMRDEHLARFGDGFLAGFDQGGDSIGMLCPCALLMPLAQAEANEFVPEAADPAPLARATGPDHLPEGTDDLVQVHHDSELDLYWWRFVARDTGNSGLQVVRRLREGGVVLLIIHASDRFDLESARIQALAAGLTAPSSPPSVAPPAAADDALAGRKDAGSRWLLQAGGALAVTVLLAGAFGFYFGGWGTAFACVIAVPLCILLLLLAYAGDGESFSRLSPRSSLPQLLGYCFGVQLLWVAWKLRKVRTRRVAVGMRHFVWSSLLVAVVLGINAIEYQQQASKRRDAAAEAPAP